MVTIHTWLSTLGKINAKKRSDALYITWLDPLDRALSTPFWKQSHKTWLTVLQDQLLYNIVCMNNKYLTQWNWDKLHTYAKGLPKAACTQICRRYIYIINATLLTQIKPEYLELGTHSHTVWLHIITNKAIKLHVLSQTKKAARVLRNVTSYWEVVPYSVKHYSIVPILFWIIKWNRTSS